MKQSNPLSQVIGSFWAMPAVNQDILPEAMTARANELENVEVVHMVCHGQASYAQPGMEHSFRHNSLFAGAATRQAITKEEPIILRVSYQTYLVCSAIICSRLDVAMVTLTPPDRHGYCSLGVSSIIPCRQSNRPNWSWQRSIRICPGPMVIVFVHVSEIDYICSVRPAGP
jgi:4-hydroxybutyrate CoA-transferase